MVRAHALRTTGSRIDVLACLLAARRALSHNDIEERLKENRQIDRTSIYRILEWLTKKQLAHKLIGDDGIWRFVAEAQEEVHNHAHFQCVQCGKMTCLAGDMPLQAIPLPSGHRLQQIELTVKGYCPDCH